MKEKYVAPITTSKNIQSITHFIVSSSYADDSNACDCFAHKGNHSKCSGGCHNSGKIGEEPIDIYGENPWSVVW